MTPREVDSSSRIEPSPEHGRNFRDHAANRVDNVTGEMRPRGMTPRRSDSHGHGVAGGRDRADSSADSAGINLWFAVNCIDLRDIVQDILSKEVERATWLHFLCRLEDKANAPLQFSLSSKPGEDDPSPQHNRGVNVVPTGVALPLALGSKGQPRGLLERQCVNIGTKC